MTEYEILREASTLLYNHGAYDLSEMVQIWADHVCTEDDLDREWDDSYGCGDSFCTICGDPVEEDE